MKKKLFVAITLLSSLIFYSQESVTIDWQKIDKSIKDKKLIEPVYFGEFHTFRIDNINKFLYKVTIEGANIELETPVPTELQNLFRLKRDELVETAGTEEAEEVKANAKDSEEQLKEGILNFKSQKGIIKPVGIDNDLDKFIKKVESHTENVNDATDEILELKVLRVELVNLALKDISFEEMENEIDDLDKQPKDPSKSLSELKKKFKELKKDYDVIKKKAKGALPTEIDEAFKELESVTNSLDKEALLLVYSDVNFLYNELKNKNNFTIVSPPVQANGDFVNYKVSIKPSKTNSLGAYKNPVTINFDVPVQGGLKVDFSVGPMFSFGNGSKDEKFYLEDSETDDYSILKERKNKNVISPGIGAMMHFYRRTGSTNSWGGLFGIGAGFQSIDDVDLSFYTGISLILGKEQKIMINTGLSFLNVDRLKSDQFNIDDEYLTSGIELNEVTEKVFKSSFFLSVSYSLANRSKR